MLFPGFPLSYPAEKVRVSSLKISERILHNPLGHPAPPGQIGVLSCGQFLLEINSRDELLAFFVHLLLARKAIIVGKASRPATLTGLERLSHSWIKFRLVSSGDLHASFSHSKEAS